LRKAANASTKNSGRWAPPEEGASRRGVTIKTPFLKALAAGGANPVKLGLCLRFERFYREKTQNRIRKRKFLKKGLIESMNEKGNETKRRRGCDAEKGCTCNSEGNGTCSRPAEKPD